MNISEYKIKKIFYDEIDSTNLEIQRLSEKSFIHDFTFVISEKQSNGKGQGGNTWESNLGGLYFSFIIRPSLNINLMSLIAGISILETLKSFLITEEIKIKWPNDILVNHKKISGVLTEGKFKGNSIDYIIIGCGINVNQNFTYTFSDNEPTSIKIETNKEINKNQVLDTFIENFTKNYFLSQKNEVQKIMDKINNSLYKKNELIKIKQLENIIEGKLLRINNDGSILLLDSENNEKNIYSGKIEKK